MSWWCNSDDNLNERENYFSQQAVRLCFIRKVYGIIMVQMVITAAIICLFIYEEHVKLFSTDHPEMFWIALALTFVILIILAWCPNVGRSFPSNIICLFLFALCEAFLLGSAASYYDKAVMFAVGICAVVCLGLTLFGFQTKIDFSPCSGALLVLMIILICFGFICIFIPNEISMLIIASAVAVIFSLYLVFDMQMMMRGYHEYSVSPQEYIFAALNVYTDIIDITNSVMKPNRSVVRKLLINLRG